MYQGELKKAREAALAEIIQNATALGANAIVGVDLDYETVGSHGGMLMVNVSGTAVVVQILVCLAIVLSRDKLKLNAALDDEGGREVGVVLF